MTISWSLNLPCSFQIHVFSIFLFFFLRFRQYVSCLYLIWKYSANHLGYAGAFSLFINFRHYQCYKSPHRVITVFQLSKWFHQFLNGKNKKIKYSISFRLNLNNKNCSVCQNHWDVKFNQFFFLSWFRYQISCMASKCILLN